MLPGRKIDNSVDSFQNSAPCQDIGVAFERYKRVVFVELVQLRIFLTSPNWIERNNKA